MPINRISSDAPGGVFFVTPTVQRWYYIFDRHDRWQILVESLQYLQTAGRLEIHAYVFMLNHVHLIVGGDDVTSCLRDFKRHTSKTIHKNIQQTEPHLAELFTADGRFSLWKEDNQPKRIENEAFYLQKLNYIHENPVRKGYVNHAEHWKWSSANPDSPVAISLTW